MILLPRLIEVDEGGDGGDTVRGYRFRVFGGVDTDPADRFRIEGDGSFDLRSNTTARGTGGCVELDDGSKAHESIVALSETAVDELGDRSWCQEPEMGVRAPSIDVRRGCGDICRSAEKGKPDVCWTLGVSVELFLRRLWRLHEINSYSDLLFLSF